MNPGPTAEVAFYASFGRGSLKVSFNKVEQQRKPLSPYLKLGVGRFSQGPPKRYGTLNRAGSYEILFDAPCPSFCLTIAKLQTNLGCG